MPNTQNPEIQELKALIDTHTKQDGALKEQLTKQLFAFEKKTLEGGNEEEMNVLKKNIYRKLLAEELHKDLGELPWDELEEMGSDPVAMAKLADAFKTTMREEKVDKDVVAGLSAFATLKPKIDETIAKNEKLMKQSDYDAMDDNVENFLKECGKELVHMNLSPTQKEKIEAALFLVLKESLAHMDTREIGVKVASEAANFIPVIGSAKILGEALYGARMDGQVLQGKARGLQLAEGAAWLLLDCFTLGGSDLIKGGKMIGRAGERLYQGGKFLKTAEKIKDIGKFYENNAALLKQVRKYGKKTIKTTKKAVKIEDAKSAIEEKKKKIYQAAYSPKGVLPKVNIPSKDHLKGLGDVMKLAEKDKKELADQIMTLAKEQGEKRESLFMKILRRGLKTMEEFMKVKIQDEKGTPKSYAKIIFGEEKNKKSEEDLEFASMIMDKIPFLRYMIENAVTKLPIFIEIAKLIDPDLAKKIEKGDTKAATHIVQVILDEFHTVIENVDYSKGAELQDQLQENVREKIAETSTEKRKNLFYEMIEKTWMTTEGFAKIWIETSEKELEKVLMEHSDKKTFIDNLKIIALVLEKLPKLSGLLEKYLPKLPYFMEIGEKIDSDLTYSVRGGEAKSELPLVKKMIEKLSTLQVSYENK